MQSIRSWVPAALVVAVCLMACPPSAHADAGIPMMPVRYPVVLLYLIPVIVIEAIYLQRHLNTNIRRTFVCSSARQFPPHPCP